MLVWTLCLSLWLTFVSSSRIYQVSISVIDGDWKPLNNASVYFILTTNDNGVSKTSPAYIIKDGLPAAKVYRYSVLLDDIGDVESLRLMHTDSNGLCVDWISVDNKTVSTSTDQDYDCSDEPLSDCQQITAWFNAGFTTHSSASVGCNWEEIHSGFELMREYNIEIQLSSIYNTSLYSQIGLSIQGFVFKDYFSPYYDLSYDIDNSVHEYQDGSSTILLTIVTYDVTPIKSLAIANGNEEEICIEFVQIRVTNYEEMNQEKTLNVAQCIQYGTSQPNNNGCNVLNIDFRKDKITTEIQDVCNIRYKSWQYEADHRPETVQYTLNMDVTDTTDDYIFYMMTGHTGAKTQCFYTTSFQLPDGESEHRYGNMINIGNPKKLFLLHDRDDDFCIDYISVHNDRTNDTVSHSEELCSKFLYDESDPGRCSVIELDFETGVAFATISELCPFSSFCEFGLYEPDYHSSGLHPTHIVLIVFMVLLFVVIIVSLACGYQTFYCGSVHACLIHIHDPCVNGCWNPLCGDKCNGKCRCPNTEDMQHNMCCYCCGCDYCNPFSIHRRRMDKEKENSIAMERKRAKKKRGRETIDEYDTEDGDHLNLTTSHGTKDERYNMGSMGDNVNLGDNIAGNGGSKESHKLGGPSHHRISRYSNPNDIDDDSDDELGYNDSDDSMELRVSGKDKKNKKYSSIDDVEDAPINSTGMYDDNDDMATSGVVDHYDDPELR